MKKATSHSVIVACWILCAAAQRAAAQENAAQENAAQENPTTPSAPEPAPVPAAQENPTTPSAPEPASVPAARSIETEIGGGLLLYYYQPLEDPDGGKAQNNFEIFEARLRLDARFGRYRLHVTPRFRDTKERAFFPGESWVEEAYVAAAAGPLVLKVGKVYAQFGKFWDNSFYGNAQQYDGLKLDLQHGVSLEGTLAEQAPIGLGFALQYFIVDGTTSYAQPNRDTQTIPGAHRRNQFIARAEPILKLSDTVKLKLGLSGTYFQADIPSLGNRQRVTRFAVDGTFSAGGLALWAEYSHQAGRHVTEFPQPGASSNDNSYVLLGAEFTYLWLTGRYNFNLGDYSEVDYSETRHNLGVAVTFDEHLMALVEWVVGQSHQVGETSLLDNSINVTLHGNF